MKTSKPLNRRKTTNAVGKQENNNNLNNNREQICDICAQSVPGPERERIFAFGKCDHHVCYVCSTRLRVICDQSDCPICREKLDSVIFSSSRSKPYAKYSLKDYLFNEKYNIYFENQLNQDSFDKLLMYECLECLRNAKSSKSNNKKTNNGKLSNDANIELVCSQEQTNNSSKQQQQDAQKSDGDNSTNQSSLGNQKGNKTYKSSGRGSAAGCDSEGFGKSGLASYVFQDVLGLKKHLEYAHKLKLCDLCLTHNKLFPFEYSYYDYIALKKHMLEGEPRTSHHGHPKCALCHQDFFNNDELLQHMSREHFHCHLCGRLDTNTLIYFVDYGSLRNHFKEKHFLCERDSCRHEQFTSAFDNDIDYQIHLVQVHGSSASNLSRGEARQRGTITLNSASHRARPVSTNASGRQDVPRNAAIVTTGTMATANNRTRQQVPENIIAQMRQQMPSRADFPALGQTSTSTNYPSQMLAPSSNNNYYPSLAQTTTQTQASSSSTTTISQRLIAGPSNSSNSFVRTVGGGYRAAEQLNEMDFPPLPEQPKSKGNKKPKAQQLKQQNNFRARDDTTGGMTLDQLISTSLTLSNRNNKFNGKKPGSKGGSSKPGKIPKQKAIKIQLS